MFFFFSVLYLADSPEPFPDSGLAVVFSCEYAVVVSIAVLSAPSMIASPLPSMLSCRALGGMHLSALTGSQTAWRRMQEKRECLFPTCCHAHKLHDDGSGRLASCWPRDSQTATSSLLTSTLISCFLLVFFSLISSVPMYSFLSTPGWTVLEYRGVCVKLIYISV